MIKNNGRNSETQKAEQLLFTQVDAVTLIKIKEKNFD